MPIQEIDVNGSTATELSSLTELAALLPGDPEFQRVVDALGAGRSGAIDGAWGSACALTIAALAANVDRTALVVCPGVRDIDALVDDLAEFTGIDVLAFPAWETLPEEHDISDSIFAARLAVLEQVRGDHPPPLIVTCLPALLQPVPSRERVAAATRVLAVGDEVVMESLLDWLVERGFVRVTAVEMPGEFTLHGGILDVFPPTRRDPVRIELFGDEIESIRSFDAETQRRVDDLQSISLTTTMPVSTGGDAVPASTPNWDGDTPAESDGGNNQRSGSLAAVSPARTASVPNSVPDDGESLIDSLSQKTWVALTEYQQCISEGKLYLQRLSDPRGLFGVDATIARLIEFPSVTVEALAADSVETSAHLRTESLEKFSAGGMSAIEELSEVVAEDHALVACHNEAERERLTELLAEFDGTHGTKLQERITLCDGRIQKGFRLLDAGLVVVGDHELFARTQARRPGQRRRAESRVIDTFLDLRDNDLVVHISHGIARYKGMQTVRKEDREEEHLLLEFRDAVMVYVPVGLIHLVQKYIGPAKTTPELSKYGGTAWTNKKAKVSDAIQDMASDMIRLQAQRNSAAGLACREDSHYQKEFDAAFPFSETSDQLHAIADLKVDMEQPRPMDRLICGDVGYGKTEVAIRSAFKCVDNGRQAAVLVPTTVLADQHFRTFSERMAEFPVSIEMLSRFRSKAEQKEILKKLKDGSIDLVIGTHRLISKDVQFRNLGLLVIDEEQKFGVKAKERLKQLRLEVDVLTLTATPIPRTLHMSLLGIRDISSLTEAPRERVPIETRVSRFDERLIRSAVMRELNRGGQIYFVHNRVHNIRQIADRLRSIVPEASVRIAHGQMKEDELELAMMDFVAGRVDILLATTIIESGLDIPNANTMFIHQADIYGLADMHQLRGRVGRDRHRAYCYLLLEEGKPLTPKAARRLKAIEEYSELGAGFRIAMRDLEIRGAGNILGTEQSGHIAAVGYELYCQLLENAVRSQKKQPLRQRPHVSIDLPVTAFFPDRYIQSPKQKIEIYRRLAGITTLAQLNSLEEELRDRFGPIPTAAKRMLKQRELQLRAMSWKFDHIRLEDGYAVLRYRNPRMATLLAHLHDNELKIVDAHFAYWTLECDEADGAAVQDELLEVLSVAEPPAEDA